ncbi:hypothetical protein RB195_007931 [Necator americanus]|uniref:Unspecific monooxygenase n=1 Tax=Necator americanus TaxID=51031 RepID=A0ABR1C3C5_NECAM
MYVEKNRDFVELQNEMIRMILLSIVFIIFAYIFLTTWMRRRSLPPGPIPLPFIGNMHQLAFKMFIEKKDFADSIRDFIKEYGSVHTFWFGPLPTVNICDYLNAVDAMVKKGSLFSNRKLPYFFELSRKGRGILASNNSHWLEQRRFALHTLRNFGLGKNLMEQRIMFEFEITCDELDKRMIDIDHLSINPNHSFDLLIGNIINRIIFTNRFEKSDEEQFFALKKKMDDIFDDFELYDLLINEWTINLPFFRRRVNTVLKPQDEIVEFLRNQVEKRKTEIADGIHVIEGEGNDFVDAFLIQIEKYKQSNDSTSFDETTLAMTLLDIWVAGQETTTSTLVWAFAYLLLHPKVKSKVVDELTSVTEPGRPLSLTDRAKTPYYNATLLEILRCASIFPMNLWRNTEEDTSIGGYMVPKGTAVTAQMSLIMSDDAYFKNSAQFDPDRFLNGDKLDQHVIPFGIGKRACLGEALARTELYLIIGNFLLRYAISADPNYMPSMVPVSTMGVVRKATPYNIVFERS